jgi:hypothetical protein
MVLLVEPAKDIEEALQGAPLNNAVSAGCRLFASSTTVEQRKKYI